MNRCSRRTVLKSLGVTTAMTGIGTVAADPGKPSVGDGLLLDAEVGVSGAREVVTQGDYAYVAYGVRTSGQPRIKTGMVVVDLTAEPRPRKVATTDVAKDYVEWYNAQNPDTISLADVTFDVLDVKVDGDVAALASDVEAPGGISLYDISDPTNPIFRSQYEPVTGEDWESARGADIHNVFLDGDYAYLTLSEPYNIDEDGDGERDAVRIFGRTGVDIANISNPANPVNTGRWLLRDEAQTRDWANGAVSPTHDIYVQGGYAYLAAWDAGTVLLDVSTPSNPSFVSQFGPDPDGATPVPPWDVTTDFGAWFEKNFPLGRYLTLPGNAHYVQPSPNGRYVYVGAETFPAAVKDPDDVTLDDYGPVDIWDLQDPTSPVSVDTIPPSVMDDDISGKAFTAHNFDVTDTQLSAAWYNGGVRLYDVSTPNDWTEVASYDPAGYSFWTAVQTGGKIVASVYGNRSERSAGGIVVLSETDGENAAPSFEGSNPPGPEEVDQQTAE